MDIEQRTPHSQIRYWAAIVGDVAWRVHSTYRGRLDVAYDALMKVAAELDDAARDAAASASREQQEERQDKDRARRALRTLTQRIEQQLADLDAPATRLTQARQDTAREQRRAKRILDQARAQTRRAERAEDRLQRLQAVLADRPDGPYLLALAETVPWCYEHDCLLPFCAAWPHQDGS